MLLVDRRWRVDFVTRAIGADAGAAPDAAEVGIFLAAATDGAVCVADRGAGSFVLRDAAIGDSLCLWTHGHSLCMC